MVELIVKMKTDKSTYLLYTDEKNYCDSRYIKVSTKRTKMEYTNIIGYLTGPYVKLSSIDYYIKDIYKKLNLANKLTDIRKRIYI